MAKKFNIEDLSGYQWLWKNNGCAFGDQAGKTVEMKDALSTPNAATLLPKVISNIVKEAAEPLLVGTSLLQRVNYSYGQTITFPAVGGMVAADIAEGQEYPIRGLAREGATVTATVGKSGLAVQVTDEMIRYSQFDVIGMHLREAGRALARHKEVKIFNYINSMGVTTHDNLNPTESIFGTVSGRSLDGSGNGSITMDDIFDAYGQLITQGFTPNTLLMHPLTWVMFIKDPTLRAFALASGGGTYFATWNGNPSGKANWSDPLGVSPGQNIMPGGNLSGETADPLNAYPQNINSAPTLPTYFNVPMRIIVSPFVHYDPKNKLTNIMMFDSSELGVLVVDEDITTEEFNDPSVDIKKIKLRERYGMAILNEGQAIGVMRNIRVVPNEIVLPAQSQISVSGSIGELDRGSAITL